MTGKIIVVTGISGSGSREFCQRYDGKPSRTYNLGQMIYDASQTLSSPRFPKGNLLNLQPDLLARARDQAFETILDNQARDRQRYERIFIDTHAQFFWNQIFQGAYNWNHLNRLNADMFLTVIDKPSAIKASQMQTEDGRVQNHDLRDILLWQNIEVNITQGWAENYGKPMYVFSRKQNPGVVDSLFDNSFLVYASFPMTDADPVRTRKIEDFKGNLRRLRIPIDNQETPIIDPADIDIESPAGLKPEEVDAISRHTVHRDLNWDVAQSTHVIAYYPDDKISLSKGVGDECTRAMQTGKYVYVICPREKISPFMEICHKVFRSEGEFFEFFAEKMKEDLRYFRRR